MHEIPSSDTYVSNKKAEKSVSSDSWWNEAVYENIVSLWQSADFDQNQQETWVTALVLGEKAYIR